MTTERDRGPGPATPDQVLDELERLAGVEHALVAEHLTLGCVLGHDLPAEDGGPATPEGAAAAGAAASLAVQEMFHLRRVVEALAAAGRSVGLERATSLAGPSGAALALDPPGGADLDRWDERGAAIAAAVDERFRALAPAVTSAPVFEGELLEELRSVIVDDGPAHAAAFAAVREAVGDRPAAGLVRVTRRQAADGFEQRLLDVADRLYGLVVTALREAFAPSGEPGGLGGLGGGAFRPLATSAMFGLDDTHRLLVQRGLLPAFTGP